jgi:hypothetical protein
MRLALITPDGPGVRNFLLGDFLREAHHKGDIYVLHNIPAKLLSNGLRPENVAQWFPLLQERDNALTFVLRTALVSGHMYRAKTRAMSFNLQLPVRGSLRIKTAVNAARVVGRLASTSEKGVAALDRAYCAAAELLPEVTHYRKLFNEIKPSVLFSSNQRPPAVLPPVLAARALGIPTVAFIFSWDNLTSKGRIAAPFDHYLVWSEQMQSELLHYYPSVSADTVHVVGTPQFDPYANDHLLWTRAEFFARAGLDPARLLICYSGGDTSICPEETEHVSILMDLIRARRVERNPQVLLRPSPADREDRYDQVRKAYPELIYAPPLWCHPDDGDWARVIPLPEDTRFLANLTQHADLNVNVASTMTLDFAIHDKPVVNIAWDVANPPPFGASLWDHHYHFEHYRPVVEFGAARFARSPQELVAHINAYLENPGLDREGRKRFVELEVARPLGQASRRIVETLEHIAR